MQSVGEKLRKARDEKKLSLDEVYKQTRVHPRILEALEQDRAETFLSLIYIKGFLRTYARYLGLDSEKLLKEYIDSRKKEAPPVAVTLEKEKEKEKKRKGRSLPRFNPFLILRAVLIISFSFAFVFYFRFVLKRISHPSGVQAVSEDLKKQKVKVEVLAVTLPKAEDLILEVKTLDTCWMRVKTDNQAIFEKTLPKGRNERWRAKKKIELRIGKPEAIEVFLNGKALDLKKAQVKRSLVITHEGIEGS